MRSFTFSYPFISQWFWGHSLCWLGWDEMGDVGVFTFFGHLFLKKPPTQWICQCKNNTVVSSYPKFSFLPVPYSNNGFKPVAVLPRLKSLFIFVNLCSGLRFLRQPCLSMAQDISLRGDIFYLLSYFKKLKMDQYFGISLIPFLFDWQGGESLYVHSFWPASCWSSQLPPTCPKV